MLTKIRSALKEYNLSNLNFRLIFYVLVLTVIGILMVGSAGGNEYMIRQVAGMILGIIGLVVLTVVNYNFIFKFYWILYIIMIVLQIAVLFFGTTTSGSTRWIDLGFIQFQPSELTKILLIIFVASITAKMRKSINSFKTIAFIVISSAIPMFLIYKEPDLSTTIVIFVTFCGIMFLSEIDSKIIGGILVVAIPVVLVAGYFIAQPESGILSEYQYNRIIGFYQEDNEEASQIRYQQENSLIAIGSGGLTGKGLNNNTATSLKNGNYISEAHTDFIFAVIGEELGFLGGAAVILLLFLIILECFITGSRAPNFSGRLYCYGFGLLIGIQSFVNIAVATMLIPNTGLTLPFVSYGLTSLVSLFCGIGIVLNVGLKRNKTVSQT